MLNGTERDEKIVHPIFDGFHRNFNQKSSRVFSPASFRLHFPKSLPTRVAERHCQIGRKKLGGSGNVSLETSAVRFKSGKLTVFSFSAEEASKQFSSRVRNKARNHFDGETWLSPTLSSTWNSMGCN